MRQNRLNMDIGFVPLELRSSYELMILTQDNNEVRNWATILTLWSLLTGTIDICVEYPENTSQDSFRPVFLL